MRRSIRAAAVTIVSAATMLFTPLAVADAAPPTVRNIDLCSVITSQSAGQLRALAGDLLPAEAKILTAGMLAALARDRAGCAGSDGPALPASVLHERLCVLATRDGMMLVADRFKVSTEKITPAVVEAARVKLECGKLDQPAATTTVKAPAGENEDGESRVVRSTKTTTATKTATAAGSGRFSQVGADDVPSGSIATGG